MGTGNTTATVTFAYGAGYPLRPSDNVTIMIGAGIGIAGAARGIGNIGGNAVEAIARQPEAKGSIGTNMIIAAALIEGFTFFALIIGLMMTGYLK